MMHHFAEFVLHHESVCLTIDAFNVFAMVLVFQDQTSKSKVNAEALTWQLTVCQVKSFFPGDI